MATKEKHLTLCFVHDNERILLGMKKRGFGANRWNGYGGKLLDGETVEEAAVREFQEEAGIKVNSMEKEGYFDSRVKPKKISLYIYLGYSIMKVKRWKQRKCLPAGLA